MSTAKTIPELSECGGRAMTADKHWEEYKLLQGKIDKIGSAKFQIKGWTVTLITLVIVASLSSSFSTGSLAITVPIIGLAFFLLERHQVRLGKSYGKRADQLEQLLRAHAIRGMRPEEKGPRVAQFSKSASATCPKWIRKHTLPRVAWRAITNSDNSFYMLIALLYVLVLILAILSGSGDKSGDGAQESQVKVKAKDDNNPLRTPASQDKASRNP